MIKLVKLGELATFSQGQQIPIPLQNTEKFEGCDTFLRIINYTQNTDDFRYIPKQNLKYLVNKEDIVMVRYGAVGFVGRGLSGVLANNLFKVNYKKELVNGDFLYRVLWSDQVQKQLLNASQSTSMAALNFTSVAKIKIPLPPLDQQKKIASILDAADAYRQKTKALISKYDELTQSLFLDMFGDPVKNEKGWEVKELGNLTKLITDGKHGNCNDEQNSGYYFVSAKDVRNNKINFKESRQIPKIEFEEVDKRTNLQAGDLVMINTGATIGRMAIAEEIPETRRCTFQKSVAIIKVKPEYLKTMFLKYVFELGLDSFVNKGSGSAIKNLLLSEMRRFRIIVPKLTFQNQFAERVQAIEQQKAQAQESLEKADELFDSLLQKAFNGELVEP